MKGIIFDIQKFCVHDGPGIRTTVFLKGCMMRCLWCHNPESFLIKPQLMYDKSKCLMCMECIKVCKNTVHSFNDDHHFVNFDNCIGCGKCVEKCIAKSLKLAGRYVEADEVIKEVLKDKKYYDSSSGGVTFSGGEPSIQFDFLMELLRLSKDNGLHICLETNGVIEKHRFEQLMIYVDIFLFDYKASDSQKHLQVTSIGNELILKNLELLGKKDHPLILRCPIIPGINEDDQHFEAIRLLKAKYSNILSVEIMPYHNTGRHKWDQLGLNYSLNLLPSASKEQKEIWEGKI